MTDPQPMLPGKRYHLARFVNAKGGVSPWCAKRPRAINLSKALWTICVEDANCKACLKAFARHGSTT